MANKDGPANALGLRIIEINPFVNSSSILANVPNGLGFGSVSKDQRCGAMSGTRITTKNRQCWGFVTTPSLEE
jgi:hypothetical protein